MKRILPILSFILLFVIHSQGQNHISYAVSTAGPIIRAYPNPATSFITFDFQKGFEKGYSIQIYNFLGKKMHEAANLGQRTTLNLAEFNRGVYFYHLFDRTGKLIDSGKFQVSK